MSYNVLARGATAHQFKNHKFIFNNNNNALGEMNPTTEHIEQTLTRYNKIKEEITQQNPDIVLLQEVDNYFYTYILKHLPEYRGYFKLYTPPPARGDLSINFATGIIWKNSIFDFNEVKTLDSVVYNTEELNLENPGGRGVGITFNNKNATLVRLKERDDNNETLSVVSVHLAGDTGKQNKAIEPKKALINYILNTLSKNTDKYKIIGGDLNCPLNNESCLDTDSCCYQWINNIMITENFKIIEQDTKVTTCDFDYSTTPDDSTLIDSIFYSGPLTSNNYSVQDIHCQHEKSSVYEINNPEMYSDINDGSDHAWIMTDLNKT